MDYLSPCPQQDDASRSEDLALKLQQWSRDNLQSLPNRGNLESVIEIYDTKKQFEGLLCDLQSDLESHEQAVAGLVEANARIQRLALLLRSSKEQRPTEQRTHKAKKESGTSAPQSEAEPLEELEQESNEPSHVDEVRKLEGLLRKIEPSQTTFEPSAIEVNRNKVRKEILPNQELPARRNLQKTRQKGGLFRKPVRIVKSSPAQRLSLKPALSGWSITKLHVAESARPYCSRKSTDSRKWRSGIPSQALAIDQGSKYHRADSAAQEIVQWIKQSKTTD